jgi:hypothetical protein
MFVIYLTDQARHQLNTLKSDRGLNKRYKAVSKGLCLLAENPRHKGLQTHEFTTLKGPRGEKVFEAYVEQATPAAYRIFRCYGPEKDNITILAITKHP